ncbi:MAG TPA: RNA polymerase sigma factor RpoH [Burkholderiales bacterium]|nr:RNA polymerase sigma factor RpoH [Burkholderiales bacterium]
MTDNVLPMQLAGCTLQSYIQAVNRLPYLSQEEEIDLSRKLRLENDLEAARKLVLSHLRVVVAVARGYTGYGLPQADLVQEGNIGLMKAVKRFDPDRGVRLVSFAIHWIKAEIHEFIIRNWRLVKIATTKSQRKLFFNLRSLKEGHESLSRDEIGRIAKSLKVKPEEVSEMETRLYGRDIPLEPTSEEEEGIAPIAYLADERSEPLKLLEARQKESMLGEGLSSALESLDDRSRRIIEARWLSEGESATLHELAAEFNVSAERIRQIEQKAMEKMRISMTA